MTSHGTTREMRDRAICDAIRHLSDAARLYRDEAYLCDEYRPHRAAWLRGDADEMDDTRHILLAIRRDYKRDAVEVTL